MSLDCVLSSNECRMLKVSVLICFIIVTPALISIENQYNIHGFPFNKLFFFVRQVILLDKNYLVNKKVTEAGLLLFSFIYMLLSVRI